MKKTMSSAEQATAQPSAGVSLPINLVHQTIAYLESHNEAMAIMLKEHYKYWLSISVHQLNQQKVAKTYPRHK
jgi:predicted transcriptional regulator